MLFLKLVFILVIAVFSLVALYGLMAFLLPLIAVQPATTETEGVKKHRAYLHGNGVHIDIILHRDDLSGSFASELLLAPDAQYIAFGWGDRGFFLNTPTWAELKFSVAFNAMVLSSPSVMHITEHREIGKDWRVVMLSQEQLNRFIAYVKGGFKLDSSGQIIPIPNQGYTENDRFFEGEGQYHCTKTCNTWVNTGLRKAGLRTGLWATHQSGILRYFPTMALESL